MAVGDEALSGTVEYGITHYFPATDEVRTISFKGLYLSIYNEATDHYAAHEVLEAPLPEFREYLVPAHYSVFIRVGDVAFVS